MIHHGSQNKPYEAAYRDLEAKEAVSFRDWFSHFFGDFERSKR
jgi:hypothetical protein